MFVTLHDQAPHCTTRTFGLCHLSYHVRFFYRFLLLLYSRSVTGHTHLGVPKRSHGNTKIRRNSYTPTVVHALLAHCSNALSDRARSEIRGRKRTLRITSRVDRRQEYRGMIMDCLLYVTALAVPPEDRDTSSQRQLDRENAGKLSRGGTISCGLPDESRPLGGSQSCSMRQLLRAGSELN